MTCAFAACKKDKPIEPVPTPPVTYPDYGQLKIGNYWVYEHFRVDTNGDALSLNIFDTCYVEKDTMINGNIYYKMYRPYWFVSINSEYNYLIIRDSLHYIVKSNGEIIFSSQDFTTVFRERYEIGVPTDTIAHVIKKMTEKDMVVSTPAGDFVTSNSRETYYIYPAWSYTGNVKYKSSRYSENIGIVSETYSFFIGSALYTERRLVSYHLN